METVFAETASLALAFLAFAGAGSLVPRRRKSKEQTGGNAFVLGRPRLIEGLGDRLLRRLAAVAAVILAVVGPAVVSIAFLYGKLGQVGSGFAIAPEGLQRIVNVRGWALGILYAGSAGLLLGAIALVLQPSEMPPLQRPRRIWPPRSRIDWPWTERPGGFRLWAARTSALGAGIGALTVVILIPVLIELLSATFEIQPISQDAQLPTGQ